MTKAGAQRSAAQTGLMLIAPDTSPRSAHLPGETANWDLGAGAGFYVDASEEPWNRHYRLYSFVLELYGLIVKEFPMLAPGVGIMGHSMGGHGALALVLRNPALFKSVSVLAPICALSQVPWGVKAFSAYLCNNQEDWQAFDAGGLMEKMVKPFPHSILIDQGGRQISGESIISSRAGRILPESRPVP